MYHFLVITKIIIEKKLEQIFGRTGFVAGLHLLCSMNVCNGQRGLISETVAPWTIDFCSYGISVDLSENV
jgi:hypothetical protein